MALPPIGFEVHYDTRPRRDISFEFPKSIEGALANVSCKSLGIIRISTDGRRRKNMG